VSRSITITFNDGSEHRYENIPDNVTPDMIEARVQKDFPGKRITNIDGGKKSNQSSELDQVKKNAGVNNSGKLSIKGLNFGMDQENVKSIMGNNFTIFGTDGWEPKFEGGKLVQISLGFKGSGSRTSAIMDVEQALREKYGNPTNIKQLQELGYYEWKDKDTVFSIKGPQISKYTGKMEASIIWATISSISYVDKVNSAGKAEQDKKRQDF
jgi:hypothetical protein